MTIIKNRYQFDSTDAVFVYICLGILPSPFFSRYVHDEALFRFILFSLNEMFSKTEPHTEY